MTVRTLEIGYDLSRPGQNYPGLIDYIKSHGTWAHPLKSSWFVRTSLTAAEMREKVKGFLDANDKVVVLDISGDNWATSGPPKEVTDWMMLHI